MPEAPRLRPEGHEIVGTFHGHVKARPRAVFEALDSRFRPGPGDQSLYTTDPAAFLIISQGGWWYRGEYRVVPDEFGSHVEHSLINVAPRARALGRLTGRKVIADAPKTFERLLRELRLELE